MRLIVNEDESVLNKIVSTKEGIADFQENILFLTPGNLYM